MVAVGAVGCAEQSVVVTGSTVTVALDQAVTSFNDHTSLGNTPANAAIVAATNSAFVTYDSTGALVPDESFGHQEIVSRSPFAVKYTIASTATWSDGVSVDAADLLLAWVADSGALNTAGFSPATFVDPATGEFRPFPDDVVYFDGLVRSGLGQARTLPVLGADGRSMTVVFDRYLPDWQLALRVGQPAHVIADAALTVVPAKDEERAAAAKKALISAITTSDTAAVHAIAQVWNSGLVVGAPQAVPVVTSGPYAVSSVAAGESVTLTANKNYHGAHRPHYETVVVTAVSDPLESVGSLARAAGAANAVDVIPPAPTEDVLGALSALNDISVDAAPNPSWEHLDLQFSRGKHATFENPALREAFIASLPRAAIVDELVRPINPEAEVRGSFVSAATPGPALVTDNVARARELVAASGYVEPAVCILFDPANPRRVAEFAMIRDSATEAGFVVTDCSKRDWQGFLGLAGEYDAALFAWHESSAAVSAPDARLRGGSTIGNFSYYASSVTDRLLTELATELTDAKRAAVQAALDDQLAADFYGAPLYQYSSVVAYRTAITGVAPSPYGGGLLWNLWEWQPTPQTQQ